MARNGQYHALVQAVLDDLERRGAANIQASEEFGGDYPRPDGVLQISTQKWFSPDVQASADGGKDFLYDVETQESLSTEASREKIEAIGNAAAMRDALFFLVVPEELQDTAQRLLNELNIQRGHVWGIVEGRKV